MRAAPIRTLVAQVARFGVVGGLGVLVDAGIFNLLRLTLLDPEHVEHGSLWAKVISTGVAIVFNWAGNRYWAFRNHRGDRVVRESAKFLVASLLGLVVGLGCLYVSRYVLGYTSLLADNIASNVVGLGLGTVLRFALYKWWVFEPTVTARPTGDSPRPARAARASASRLRRRTTAGPADVAPRPDSATAP